MGSNYKVENKNSMINLDKPTFEGGPNNKIVVTSTTFLTFTVIFLIR